MAEPTTVNGGLIIPATGDLVGTWGSAGVNPDFVAIDGALWGVQQISVSNAPVVLTAPSGFTATPSGGPTQAQNAVLTFTGAMTGNVQVTLPIPGPVVIRNFTTGAFVLSFRAIGSGAIIAVNQGKTQTVYNDGTNVDFVNLGGDIGEISMWSGRSSMPAWVLACSKAPYLLCDGTVYNISSFPYLGGLLNNQFGGNGISTFAVPDLRGRVQVPFDATGRITTAGCGINGTTIGATNPGGTGQNQTLATANLPAYTPSGSIAVTPSGTITVQGFAQSGGQVSTGVSFGSNNGGQLQENFLTLSSTAAFTGNAQGGTSTPVPVVQPSMITGIAVIRAA